MRRQRLRTNLIRESREERNKRIVDLYLWRHI